ncbi:TPA: toprim domain-containing protein, partial [Streptococcus agalactiae]|nr:toprim domain-containing protein [Streptococcus agalactiae]
MAQALYRKEPVLVFKAFDHRHVLVGASLQGLKRHIGEKRPYLKRMMKHSEGHVGVSVDIGGKPNRLVFTESVIDAMSYFELHQSSLENTRLVAMDGLKRSCIAYQLLRLIAEEKKNLLFLDSLNPSKLLTYLTTLIETTTYFKETPGVITLAVDHDKAGLDFIGKCSDLSLPFQVDLPHLQEEKGKSDWN